MRHAVFLVYHLLFYTWPSVVNMFSSLLLHELLLVLRCCSTFMQPTARVFFNLLYTYPSHRSIFYVRGSVHHSTIREEKSNKMQKLSKYFYSIFIWSSACFGRHTAHHQEPKTALAASGYSYVEGCWTCSWWTLSGTLCPPTTRSTTFHVWKIRGCQCSFGLLMMGGVSPETCWASYKYGIIKVLIYCCILLDFSLRIVNFSGDLNFARIVSFSK